MDAAPAARGAAEPRAALPRMPYGHGEMAWWGIVFLLAIETTVFASLIFSYFYLRAGFAEWPPAGIDPPDLLLPTINTVVLLASAAPVAWADHGIRRGNQLAVRVGKLGGQTLLVVFLVLKAVEYAGYDYTWQTNAYGSIVWTLTGFHVAHVTVALLKSAVVLTLAWKGYFSERRYLGVQANAFYWYFVVIIWIPIYVTIYLAPRFV